MNDHTTEKEERPKPTVPLQPIKSSMLYAGGYDSDAQVLYLQFKEGGPIYRHEEVPPDVALGLTSAESAGKFYGASIRNKFKASKL